MSPRFIIWLFLVFVYNAGVGFCDETPVGTSDTISSSGTSLENLTSGTIGSSETSLENLTTLEIKTVESTSNIQTNLKSEKTVATKRATDDQVGTQGIRKPANEDPNKGGSNTVLYIMVTICAVAFITGIVVGAIVVYRKDKKTNKFVIESIQEDGMKHDSEKEDMKLGDGLSAPSSKFVDENEPVNLVPESQRSVRSVASKKSDLKQKAGIVFPRQE